jgi:H+/Cl- antiporter ClcA/CBS domain-containing protein
MWQKLQRLIAGTRAFLQKHWRKALQIREKIRFSEEAFHLVLAGGVGVMGGLVNLLFYYCMELVRHVALRRPGDPVEVAEYMETWQRVLTPTLGGLAAGLVLYWGLRLVGRQGSSNLLEVVVAGDGRLPFRSAVVKFLSSLVTIGTGGSIGREGGIVQLSATFASKWGQISKWHPYRLRLLVGCGAASGIAAAYNAPISGAVFAALIVLGNFSMNLFAPLVFASVIASMVSRSFFGLKPAYSIPSFEFTSLMQLPWFLLLGIITGAAGAGFLKLLNSSESTFKRIKAPIYWRLALGGLIVGLIGIWFPWVWGNGYFTTSKILHGEYGAPAFSPKDIINLESFAQKLTDSEDNLSRYVAAQLSEKTRTLLADYTNGVDYELQRSLAEDLNRIIRSGPLFEPQRFENHTLSADTIDLLNQKPQGGDLARLDRMLLLDAYRGDLSTEHGSKLLIALGNLSGLFVAKLIATLATVGSGAVGGVFTPTLFLGAALGGLFAVMLQLLGAGENLPIALFAAVGMGSMLSATTRSPLLAMIMVFEMSLDYSMMPPLMLACVVSVLVARRLHPESIYTEPLRAKGLAIAQDPSASEETAQRTVADFMRSPVPPVRENATLREIADRFLTSTNNFLPVVDGKYQLVGLVALQDLKEYLNAGDELRGIIAYDVMRPPTASVTPNQRLLEVLPVVLASEQRNIPVVNTLKENRLIGALVRGEVLGVLSEAIATKSKAEG